MTILHTIEHNPSWLQSNPLPGPLSRRIVDTLIGHRKRMHPDDLVPHDQTIARIRIMQCIATLVEYDAVVVIRHQLHGDLNWSHYRVDRHYVIRTLLYNH